MAASFIRRSRDQAQQALTYIKGDRLEQESHGPMKQIGFVEVVAVIWLATLIGAALIFVFA